MIRKHMVVAYLVIFLIDYSTVLYLSTSNTSGLIVTNKTRFFPSLATVC